MTYNIPVFINCRDRISPLKKLIDGCRKFGLNEIYLIDNASTYQPLVDYYLENQHSLNIIYLNQNMGMMAPWTSGTLQKYTKGRKFIISDPDVYPFDECPENAIELFLELMNKYSADKVGFGLPIDNVPDTYRHKKILIEWESQFWKNPIPLEDIKSTKLKMNIYKEPIDTTFVLFKENISFSHANQGDKSIRTGYPYVAVHYPWFVDSDNLSEEDKYYYDHCVSQNCVVWERTQKFGNW